MTVPGNLSSPLLATAAAAGAAALQIDRSLRFNSGDSAYLNRTPSSAGNRKTWTWSSWVKRSDSYPNIFTVDGSTAANFFQFVFETNDQLYVRTANNTNNLITTAKFRDFSAWYHVVLAVDTTQATASNRLKLYVNGSQVTQFDTESYPAQNADLNVNTTNAHYIGRAKYDSFAFVYSDGYFAEVNFVDGTQLAATDFGEYDDNNVWQPKQYSGTYGTNGFRLSFADNSSNSALGNDSSGNDNDFTVYNLTAREEAWSNYMTTTGTFLSNNGPGKAFDNSLSGADVPALDGGQAITWSPPGGLAYSSKVEIYVGGIGGFTYSFNGATAVTATTNAWNVLDTGSGTINSIVFDRGVNETHGPHAIRVDNVILQDGTPSNTDSLIDTPTNYTADSGNNGGNYATLNPLDTIVSLTNGNLETNTSSGWQSTRATFGMSSGKWYWETQNKQTAAALLGIAASTAPMTSGLLFGSNANPAWTWAGANRYFNGTSAASGSLANHTASDIVMYAFDADAGKLWFGRNGTWYDSSWGTTGNPATGANATVTGIDTSATYMPAGSFFSGGATFNFGQRPFEYTPPSGFKSLSTQNLADPTIADGSTAFDVVTATGTGAERTFTMPGGFGPDLVWSKSRSDSYNHGLFDTVRGGTKRLRSNSTATEDTSAQQVKSFTSDGFVQGTDVPNTSGETGVYWAWDAGTSTASNTDGNVTANVRANAAAGFSIISVPSIDSTNTIRTAGHNLNSEPYFIISKNRDFADHWFCYHKDVQTNNRQQLRLNTTDGTITSGSDLWAHTSSVIGFNGALYVASGNTDDLIFYCWTPVEGFSAFGSYATNGSADGPFVYTGFRPRWALLKESSASGELWVIYDSERNTSNVMGKQLYPSSNAAEADASADTHARIDFLSNGFKIRGSHSSINTNGETVVYAAFAEHSFKTSRAR